MSSSERTEHALINRQAWSRWAEDYRPEGRDLWARNEPGWGTWAVPETELRVLPDVDGIDVLELGCGRAYWSAWLARRGARPVGPDQSPEQLESAPLFQLPQERPVGERLLRPLFSLHQLEWTDDPSISFGLPHSEWIRLFRETGFAIEALIDVQAPADGSPGRFDHLRLDWARQWPSEQIWKVEKL